MKQFEVEQRALLDERTYTRLKEHFENLAQGEIDDAETYTFLTKTKNIKVKNLISKGKAKITVKQGAEYQQGVDETELPIDPSHVKEAVQLITSLGYDKYIPSLQKRINYTIDDIAVSLKHETNWKYHIEAEVVVADTSDIPDAKEKLHTFFKNLGITPMTEEDTRSLINGILKRYGMEDI